jgi:hypothetical protein
MTGQIDAVNHVGPAGLVKFQFFGIAVAIRCLYGCQRGREEQSNDEEGSCQATSLFWMQTPSPVFINR